MKIELQRYHDACAMLQTACGATLKATVAC